MILHAFLTDGLFDWAKLFVDSFRITNGSDIPIVLCTRNLTDAQVNELSSSNEKVTVKNSHIDLRKLSEEFGISYEELLKHKKQIEKVHITEEARIWKQYTSADQRIRSIYETMKENPNEDYILHSDIDMYFRKPLVKLYDLMYVNDICIRFRLHTTTGPHRKVMGGLLGFKISPKVFKFMDRWEKYLDDIPIPERKIGYGQTSLYYAYRDLKDNYTWGDIPGKYISPFMKEEDVVWSANTYAGKTKNLAKCRADLGELRRELDG